MSAKHDLSLTNSSTSTSNYHRLIDDHFFDKGGQQPPPSAGNDGDEQNYIAYLLIIFPLWAIIGNSLVIISVCREKSLQCVTNYFIVNLALADLLVAITAMPFHIYTSVNTQWMLGDMLCDFSLAIDCLCTVSSIFSLVAISIDRTIAVIRPLSYQVGIKSKNRVFITITMTWLASILISAPMLFGYNDSPHRIEDICTIYNVDYAAYGSVLTFWIPSVILVIVYWKIFTSIRVGTRKFSGRRHGPREARQRHRDHARERTRAQMKRETEAVAVEAHAVVIRVVSADIEDDKEEEDTSAQQPSDSNHPDSAYETCDNINEVVPPPSPSSINALSDRSPERRLADGFKKRERKATMTLLLVLITFFACWAPFWTSIIIEYYESLRHEIDFRFWFRMHLYTGWIGYVNSCLNFVIYAVFNVQFRRAFKKILCGP